MAKSFDKKKINERFFLLFSKKTRAEMSALLDVSQGSLSEWANGKKQVPWDKLALAKELSGKSWDWILGADVDTSSNQTEQQDEAPEAAATNAPTPVSALPAGNAIRRKGDQDAAHKVLHLRLVGDAAALEKGASHRGGFDDESLYWDHTEEIPESTYLVRIRGDSMVPLMMHGQSVMVGTQYRPEIGEVPRDRELVIAEVTVQDNDIGGIDGEWEGVHCKRIQDGGDFWHFTSINPAGASFSVAKANCRLWHVIGVYFGEKSKIPEED